MSNTDIQQSDPDHPATDEEKQWRDELLGLPHDVPPEQEAYELAQGNVVDTPLGDDYVPF